MLTYRLHPLTPFDLEVLRDLCAASKSARSTDTRLAYREGYIPCRYIGGSDASDHSRILVKLVKRELAEVWGARKNHLWLSQYNGRKLYRPTSLGWEIARKAHLI